MSDTVNKLFFAGNQGVDIVRHLVKCDAKSFKARTLIKVDTLIEMPIASFNISCQCGRIQINTGKAREMAIKAIRAISSNRI